MALALSASTNQPLQPVPNYLDWASFIRSCFTDSVLTSVFLPSIFQQQWVVAGTKAQMRSRLQTLSRRLNLSSEHETPWLLYLHMGVDVTSVERDVKAISAWTNCHEYTPEQFLSTLSDVVLKRHGRNPDALPAFTKADRPVLMAELNKICAAKAVSGAPPRRTAATTALAGITTAARTSITRYNPRKRARVSSTAPSNRSQSIEIGLNTSYPTITFMPPETSSIFSARQLTMSPIRHAQDDEISSIRSVESEEEMTFEQAEKKLWERRMNAIYDLVELGDADIPVGDSFVTRQAEGWHRQVVHAARYAAETEHAVFEEWQAEEARKAQEAQQGAEVEGAE